MIKLLPLITILISLFVGSCTDIEQAATPSLNDTTAVVDYEQLKVKLEKILVRDQTLRRLHSDAVQKFGRASDEMTYFWQLIAMTDSINEAAITPILDEYGWLGTNKIGFKANKAIWLVVQHAPLETQENYLPLLEESVSKRESSGEYLAMLADRIRMRKGKPQIYGSQIVRDEKSKQMIVYEVWEPEYINQRRKKVGLSSIEEYVKNWGIEWSIDQKEK